MLCIVKTCAVVIGSIIPLCVKFTGIIDAKTLDSAYIICYYCFSQSLFN